MFVRLLILTLAITACHRPVSEKKKPCQGGNPGLISLNGNVDEKIVVNQPIPGNSADPAMKKKSITAPIVNKRTAQKVATLGTNTVTLEGTAPDIQNKIVADKVIMKNVTIAASRGDTSGIEIEANELILEGKNSIVTYGPQSRDSRITAPPITITVHDSVSGPGELQISSKGLNCR